MTITATRTLRIGEAAKLTGVSSANIRFYEKEGLLPAAKRQDNSYRSYSAADLHRLRFIRTCRAMDMSLDEVRTLLALDWSSPGDCCAATQTTTPGGAAFAGSRTACVAAVL